MNLDQVINLQKVAESAVVEAGEMSIRLQEKPLDITKKGFRNYVSEADLASQQQIMENIRKHFPDHEFLSEEARNASSYKSSVIWIIDPIDGTTNYIRGQPLYSISVAAAVKTEGESQIGNSDQLGHVSSYEIVAGVIYDPHRQELFSANTYSGVTLNHDPIRVSEITELKNAVIGFDWSRDFRPREELSQIINRLSHNFHTLRAIGSAALALAWVACGRLDLYFNLGVGPWDAAAAKVIIEKAGGSVTDLEGMPWDLGQGALVASNGTIHEEFVASLRLNKIS